MKISKPTYYDSFLCSASACPDSCCKDWIVQVDDESAQRYRRLSGNLGASLRQAMAQADGDTILTLTPSGKCPMWLPDGLCRIQAELGADALCRTCRNFPRLRHDYGDFLELGLELSCPEAAKWILSGKWDYVTLQATGGEKPEYDTDAMAILYQSRQKVLHFLENEEYPIEQTLAIILIYGYALQEALDGGRPADIHPESTLATAKSIAADGDINTLLEFFQRLEILTPAWNNRLQAPVKSPWREEHRAMTRYFVYRYWLQAISDYDLVSRIKLIIVSNLVIKALGGDIYQTAQLYSKEIENNTDNIDAILNGAYTSPAMTDTQLLDLLLKE